MSFLECTFIILAKQQWADGSVEEEQCMVGDVNIFLTDPTDPTLAELEIMIAGDARRVIQKQKKQLWNISNQPVLISHTFTVYLRFNSALVLFFLLSYFRGFLSWTEPAHRGKGIGREATHMMMSYGEQLTPSARSNVQITCCYW